MDLSHNKMLTNTEPKKLTTSNPTQKYADCKTDN